MSLDSIAEHYDYVIVCDGSGINKECAWAAILLTPGKELFKFFRGGVSQSTINVAEAIGFLHVLSWLEREGKTGRVLLLSDSLITVRCGSGEFVPRANKWLWNAFQHFQEVFQLHFLLIPRCSFKMAVMVDEEAGRLRRLLAATPYPDVTEMSQDDIWEGLPDVPGDRPESSESVEGSHRDAGTSDKDCTDAGIPKG